LQPLIQNHLQALTLEHSLALRSLVDERLSQISLQMLLLRPRMAWKSQDWEQRTMATVCHCLHVIIAIIIIIIINIVNVIWLMVAA
jgi:hypothetical protein